MSASLVRPVQHGQIGAPGSVDVVFFNRTYSPSVLHDVTVAVPTLSLAIVAVPIVMYGLMARLHRRCASAFFVRRAR